MKHDERARARMIKSGRVGRIGRSHTKVALLGETLVRAEAWRAGVLATCRERFEDSDILGAFRSRGYTYTVAARINKETGRITAQRDRDGQLMLTRHAPDGSTRRYLLWRPVSESVRLADYLCR